MERTVRVWIGNDYIDYEIEDNGGLTEDELYEKACDEIFSIISIEVI